MGGHQDRQGFLPLSGPGCDGDYGGGPEKWKTVYVEEVKTMNAMKCDRCGSYFDSNKLKIKGGNCSGEPFGYISLRGEKNYCCQYDLCDDCVVDFFQWVNDPGRLRR